MPRSKDSLGEGWKYVERPGVESLTSTGSAEVFWECSILGPMKYGHTALMVNMWGPSRCLQLEDPDG